MINTEIPITIDGNALNFYNTPAQSVIFNQTKTNFIVLHKGRRMGCTQGAANKASKSLFNSSVLWVDTIQANLETYYNIYFLPIFKKIKSKFWQYKTQNHELRFINGNTIYFRSAERAENIEGLGAGIKTIILNEAGHILKGKRGRNLWYNTIYPMILDHNPAVYIMGTPKGKRAKKGETLSDGQKAEFCLFYELAQKGYSDNQNWISLNFTSYDNPLIPEENIRLMEADVPRIIREQEIYGRFIDISVDAIFQQAWWRYVDELPLPQNRKRIILSIDTAFKTGEENDSSAFVVFLEYSTGYLWLDTYVAKLEFPQLINKTIELYNDWHPDLVLVEDKGSGTSLVQTLKQNCPFAIAGINPDRDKISRAQAVTPLFETGRVTIMKGKWNKMATDQLEEFNAALDSDDDIVDAVSQCLNYIKGSSITQKPVILKGRISKRLKTVELMQGY